MKWISIKEALPNKEGKYLTAGAKGNISIKRYFINLKSPIFNTDKYGYYTGFISHEEVTHWMELPDPPSN